MNTYYIVLETNNKLVSDIIDTENNLDTTTGLVYEMGRLEKKYGSSVIVMNWKRMNKRWWQKKWRSDE